MEIRHELIANSLSLSLSVFAGMFNSLDRLSIAIYVCSEYVIQSESNLCFNFWGFMDELLSSFACSISGKFLRKLPVDIAMATALASARPRPLRSRWNSDIYQPAKTSGSSRCLHRSSMSSAPCSSPSTSLALYVLCPLSVCKTSKGPNEPQIPLERNGRNRRLQQQQNNNNNNEHIKWRNVFLGCNCRVTLQVPSVVSLYVCWCVCGEVTYSCHMNLQLLANELPFAEPPSSLTV